MMSSNSIPLSLYVHLPWCIKKCPYCDFNSHRLQTIIPEKNYLAQLCVDIENDITLIQERKCSSIFFGGGTPSLFSPDFFHALLSYLKKKKLLHDNIEITLEANPGTVDAAYFRGYRQAGINRLSLGIQSFNDNHLKKLGRIHGKQEAIDAIAVAKSVAFDNLNLDLMFALPEQTCKEAMKDLEMAFSFEPQHISWYQLTLEPNTVFYKYPPPLPDEEIAVNIFENGQAFLRQAGYIQYEVSAYATQNFQCQHNLNYWQFGDYLGVGAGAHGKITIMPDNHILRRQKYKLPQAYLQKLYDSTTDVKLSNQDKLFEFMLNALRLYVDIPFSLFEERTGLSLSCLLPYLIKGKEMGLLDFSDIHFFTTTQGRIYLNNLMEIFL